MTKRVNVDMAEKELSSRRDAEFDARTRMIEDRERQARRDMYAAAVLPQIMSEVRSWDTSEMNRIAGICYMMADAMEAARLKLWSK